MAKASALRLPLCAPPRCHRDMEAKLKTHLNAIMKTFRFPTLLILLLFGAGLNSLRAQSYSVDWFTINGGGGTNTNGQYSVSGTLGQSDANGAMTGGNYSVTGGFWSLFATQTPGAPLLNIFHTATNTTVVS